LKVIFSFVKNISLAFIGCIQSYGEISKEIEEEALEHA